MNAEQPSIREQLSYQEEQGLSQSAQSMAQEQAMRLAQEKDREGYWDVITDADVGWGDGDELPDFIATETSGMLALGNITDRHFDSGLWRIENQFDLMHNEFIDNDSTLDEIDVAAMEGEAKPTMTDRRIRRLRSAQTAAKQEFSLSRGAMGLRMGSEIHTVAKSEKIAEEEEPGTLGKIKRSLI